MNLVPKMPVFDVLSASDMEAYIPQSTRSLALMAAYDSQPNHICPNLIKYLKELASEFEVVLLLTNERPLAPSVIEQLPASCRVKCVPNLLLDFGMWARVLQSPTFPTTIEHIGLFNDSCYLVHSLSAIFTHAKNHGYEFWGLVKNDEIATHLQSFFLVAERNAVPKLLSFFKSKDMAALSSIDKGTLIHTFEVGLSLYMSQQGTPLQSVYSLQTLHGKPPTSLHKWKGIRAIRHINLSYSHWDTLLSLGCPLLKKNRASFNRAPEEAAYIRTNVDVDLWPTISI